MSLGRRDAIRLALGAAVGGTGACQDADDRADDTQGADARDGATPLVEMPFSATRWAEGMVYVRRSQDAEVVAYVSMASRRVFVDRDFRDRASWLLKAHISVSTWHWRIPLPGDDPGVPISPGDHAREFEEFDISEWDSTLVPAFDDIRIVRGQPQAGRLVVPCSPLEGLPGAALALQAPVELLAVVPGAEGTEREDFHVLGAGLRSGEDCSEAGDVVQLVGWAVRS